MIRLITALSAFNGYFRTMDENLPPEEVPDFLESLAQAKCNACHAWSEQDGGLQQCIAKGDYEKILKPFGNRLLKRYEAICTK